MGHRCHAQMPHAGVLFQGQRRASAGGDLYRGCELRRLIDCRLRIQFGGLVSTANQIHRQTFCLQRVVETALRFLTGTDDHRVDV